MADRKRAPRSKDVGRDRGRPRLSVPYGRSQAEDERQDGQPSAAGLTKTEERIFDDLIAGKSCRETCQELGISRSLYHYHLHAMRRYFRVRTTVEAILAYVRHKAAREDPPTP